MRGSFRFLAVSAFFAICSTQSTAFDPSTLENSIVQIAVISPDGKNTTAIGTGFCVGSGSSIATAAHVYWEAGLKQFEFKGGIVVIQRFSRSGLFFRVPFEFENIDNAHDAAIGKFDVAEVRKQWPSVELKSLPLANREPKAGEPITLLGYLDNERFPWLVKGSYSGLTDDVSSQLVLDMHINRGQSGSPILSEDGTVLGIAVGFIPVSGAANNSAEFSGLSRAIKIEHLRKLIVSKP